MSTISNHSIIYYGKQKTKNNSKKMINLRKKLNSSSFERQSFHNGKKNFIQTKKNQFMKKKKKNLNN